MLLCAHSKNAAMFENRMSIRQLVLYQTTKNDCMAQVVTNYTHIATVNRFSITFLQK